MPPLLHLGFDILACLTALAVGLWQRRQLRLPDNPHVNGTYVGVLLAGCVVGGYFFGTWNLVLSHQLVLAHSVLGAISGGILFIEIYKIIRGIHVPTGAAYALPFCAAVVVGRIGCLLAGMDDMTYGTPTALPWGMDFGDGVLRHPVQLYESAFMAGVAIFAARGLARKPEAYIKYAFPAVVGIYGLQRFFWEFLKPYATVFGGLNMFQYLCLGLIGYSLILIYRRSRPCLTSH